jgi:hypothetical protein
MGTNYYHERDGYEGAKCTRCGGFCEHCRDEAKVHIGKSSSGWTFMFQATGAIRSYRQWLEALGAGGRIVDEYGDVVTLDDFKGMVERRRTSPHNHAIEYPDGSFLDPDGHSFSVHEFS